jgi:hypothetical protein
MSTKLDKMRQELENEFRDNLHKAFYEKYKTHLTTEFNIFSMQLMSTREDRQDFTEEQHTFVAGYSEGYGKAISMVLMRDARDDYERAQRQNAKEVAA